MWHITPILALALTSVFARAQAAPPGQLAAPDPTRNYTKAVPPQHGLPVAGSIPVFTSVNGVIVHALATWTDPKDGTKWYVQCADYTNGSPQQCLVIIPVENMRGLVPSTGLSADGMSLLTFFKVPPAPVSDDETTYRALIIQTFSALYGQVLGQLGLPPSAVQGLTRARAPGSSTRSATGNGGKTPDAPGHGPLLSGARP